MAKHSNSDGVTVDAEEITQVAPGDEDYLGFWQTTDKDGVIGRVPADLFHAVFSPVNPAASTSTRASGSKGNA